MIDPTQDVKAQLQDASAQLDAELVPLQKSLDLVSTMMQPVQTTQMQITTLMQGLSTVAAPLAALQDTQNQLTSLLNEAMAERSVASTKVKAALADLTTAVISVDRTGNVDVTAAIQAYLNKGGSIYLPAGQYLIDAEVELKPVSNTDWVLDDNAVLIAKPNSNPGYKIIHLERVENVTITGGKLVGDRDKHNYVKIYLKDGVTLSSRSTHEWGHGIGIGGAKNCTIRGMELYNFTGDGISAGASKDVSPWIRSTGILIDSVDSHDNRRQGLSITNVNGFKVINSKFRRIGLLDGTSPRCGIDIEPDNDTNSTEAGTCDNVWIEGCWIGDNQTYGLNIFARVANITVKDNNFVTNNSCGAVVVDGTNIVFTGNFFDRNGSTGLFVTKGVDSYTVDGNTFNLNYAKQGPKARTTPIVKAGIVTGTARDLLVATDVVAKGTVLTNTYK